MEHWTTKIAKIVKKKNYISAMKCQESIQKTMIFGLEKRRSKLDKEFNRKKKVKITWSEIDKNQAKWEDFLVCQI